MKKVLLLRFGELYLKGKNRNIFESQLINNIKAKLQGEIYQFHVTYGRYVVSGYDESREAEIIRKLQCVFGLYSLSPAVEITSDLEEMEKYVRTIDLNGKSFKVNAKRADKTFPLRSMELDARLGEVALENNACRVDLYNPEVVINVEVRMNGRSYIYFEKVPCSGGLPLGSAGKALVLLSGGIDSPVSAYLMAKRGLKLEALHFHSYPYTSERAKQKVITLAEKLTEYLGPIKLHVVSFTKVQEAIHANCAPEYMITIMRRIMMRIAERISEREGLGAIVTGESLGQVASQTMQSMTVTGGVLEKLPAFRPCIAMDKEEIMAIAKNIDTYETSILPYEDCCTVFLPKFPVIKPTIEKAEREEKRLDLEALIEEALESEEVIEIGRK